MLKFTLLGTVAGAGIQADLVGTGLQADFKKFMMKFGKEYDVDEVAHRFSSFKDNVAIIEEHNAQNLGWTMAINEFTDLTPEEFSALYKGYKPRDEEYRRSQNLFVPDGAPLDSIDWRDLGAVTPVKNQGQCGSCWAFSTTGSMEGAYFLSKGKLPSLSEQQLVDCAGSAGNQGCNGGLMDNAFEYIIANKGLSSEQSYPYKARAGTCQTRGSVANIDSYKDVSRGSESDLKSAVSLQPVSIAVDAQKGWQLYSGGVFTKYCGKRLDHGVLAVGYGTDSGIDYWIVKNSWGKGWGESGYIRLVAGKDTCGLADAASFPHVP